ncbi:MAG: hypothetical protein D6757_05020 [Alphaproteobacteria bacterium]|nr:MAG: hypothetical protein D6757_05020 [Alphaproteobacteria bacterium]
MIREKLKVIAAKIETNYAVDPVPNPATDAMLVENLSLTPLEANEIVPDGVVRSSFGAELAIALTGKQVKIEFDVPYQGAGTPGGVPFFGTLLRGAGFAQVVTGGVSCAYNTVTGGEESLTIQLWRDGIVHKAVGCRGDWSLKLDAGGRLMQHFAFTGLYQPVADAALPAATLPPRREIPVDAANTPTFTLMGTALALKSLEIKRANDVQFQQLVNDTRVDILGRKPEGSATVRESLTASFNAWQMAEAGTTGALSLVHGNTAGNIVEINCPNVQIGKPGLGAENGVSMLTLPLRIASTSPSANDDIQLVVR